MKQILPKIIATLTVLALIGTVGFYHYTVEKQQHRSRQAPSSVSFHTPGYQADADGPNTRTVSIGNLTLDIKNEYREESFLKARNDIVNRAEKQGWQYVDLGPNMGVKPTVPYKRLDRLSYVTPTNKIAVFVLTETPGRGTHISSTELNINRLLSQPLNSRHQQQLDSVPAVYQNIVVGKPALNIGRNPDEGSSVLVCFSDNDLELNKRNVVSKLKKAGWTLESWPQTMEKKVLNGQTLIVARKKPLLCQVMLGKADSKTFTTYRISKDIEVSRY